MANLDEKIINVVSGDDFQVVRTIDNISVGQHLIEAWFTIKENKWDADYIFQKHITTIEAANQGVISDTGDTDQIANLQFNLIPANTLLLIPFYEYVYDIQVKTNVGYIYTPELGTFISQFSLTEAS